MKRLMLTAGLLTAGFCLNGSLLHAQQDQQRQQRGQVQQNEGLSSQAGRLDERTRGANLRASQLIGMDIQNSQGEGVGEIEDLVLDATNGRVRYAAVSYGGFLGLGDKLFAVPFAAFQVGQDPDNRDELVLVLNVTEQQLEGAEGFDEDNWPNFADRNFTSEIDRRYGVERQRDGQRRDRGAQRRNRDGGVQVEAGRDGVQVDVDRDRDRN